MKVKTVTLAVQHWQKLLEVAADYEDRGPADEGYQSSELAEAVAAFEDALEASPERDVEPSSLNSLPD